MAPRRIHSLLVIILGLLPAFASLAQAISGEPSLYIDPSIQTSGMGEAGTAVFWGDQPNDWANPALLGSQRGIRYLYGRTQFVPDLADDVYFTSKRLLIGAAGIGVSMTGKPIHSLGELRLDYGTSEATDPDGNVIGTFEAYEVVRQFGVGINLLEATENALRRLGKHAPDLSRRVDLSVGHTWKTIEADLAPAYATLDGSAGRGKANERDRGVLLRFTPLGRHGETANPAEGARWQVDTAIGFSQRNYTDERISVLDEDQTNGMSEERILALAARASIAFPGAHEGGVWDFIEPSLALGLTAENVRYYESGIRIGGDAIRRLGEELAIADVLFLRHGYVHDPAETVEDHAWGAGAQVRYRKAVGIRYDFASIPQSKFLDHVKRNGVTIFVDPYRIWKGFR